MKKALLGLALSCALAFSGNAWASYSSTQSLSQRIDHVENPHPYPSFSQKRELSGQTTKSKIMKEFSHWSGTRYKFGGSTKKGVDCSAFIQHIYRDALNVKIPRTTSEQKFKGQRIAKKDLKVGDMVFFRGDKHVGIYIGNNQFIHSGSKTGVSIQSLDHKYYASKFTQARRIL